MSDSIDIVQVWPAQAEGESEARRVMNLCNSCRYCEGLCATFKAMTHFREFSLANLDYLANLCHNCSACYYGCQYAPPHDFDINVPKVLTTVRLESYRSYAWPRQLGDLFERNGVLVTITLGLCLFGVLLAGSFFMTTTVLTGVYLGPGAFYQVVSHELMVLVAGATFGFCLLSLAVSGRKFWQQINSGPWSVKDLVTACKSAVRLDNLDGGHGNGCNTAVGREEPFGGGGESNLRRYAHHFTMWGFLLCFASTLTASVYDYGLGLVAPYAVTSLPVLLGLIGGVGLLVGPAGLFFLKRRTDRDILTEQQLGMDYAFLVALFCVSVTGLGLLALRETEAMGLLLLVHLGFVLGFFVCLPFSKFVHGLYRFLALLEYSKLLR